MHKRRKDILILCILLLILLIMAVFALSTGELKIPFTRVPSILCHGHNSMEHLILTKIRFPRILLGIAVGGSLALAGVILQGIYRNPLVEPYTLGISGGASLGVTLVIVTGFSLQLGGLLLPASGFAGALVATIFVYALSLRQGKIVIYKMVLIGVTFSFIASSLMLLLISTTTAENLHGIIFWVMGSLDESSGNLIITVSVISLLGLAVSCIFFRSLNALRLGEASATHLGVNTNVSVKILFLVASILTGVSVSVAGIIGFVGLIIPQFLRLVVSSDHRFLLPASFLTGASFLLFCDTLARTIIAPNELPLGVITGIFGGSAFIGVLLRRSSKTLITG